MKNNFFWICIFLFIPIISFSQSNYGVTAILSPSSSCELSYPQTVIVRFSRLSGVAVAVGVELTYSLNGVPIPAPEQTNLAAGGGADNIYIFSTQINSNLVYGLNTLTACARNTLEGSGSSGDDCRTITFYNYKQTIGGGISGSTSVCAGTNSGSLVLNGNEGCVLRWESSTDNGANWNTIANSTGKTVQNYTNLTQTTLYRAIVQSGCGANGSCQFEYSSVGIITVNAYPAAPILSSNSPICSGENLKLSSSTNSSSPSYTWSGPNGFSSTLANPEIINVTNLESGSYSLTITQNGCVSNSSTINVTVNQTPSAPSITSNASICTGDTLAFFTPTISGANYSWIGPNSFNSIDQNPVILNATGAASGVYSMRITLNGCTGPFGTLNVVMKSTPNTPIASVKGAVCENDPLELNASTVVGVNYNWFGPNGFTSNAQNPDLSMAELAESGEYFVYADLNGCLSDTTKVNVKVNPLPNAPIITSNSPLCEGAVLLLHSNSFVGHSYNWTGPNGFSSTQQNPGITGVNMNAVGTYQLSVQNNLTGCISPTVIISVQVKSKPIMPSITSNSPICVSDSIRLFCGDIGVDFYEWKGPNGFTSSVQNPTVFAQLSRTGDYSLRTSINGCYSDLVSLPIEVKANPSAPSLSTNSPICAGQDLRLFAGNVLNGSYEWFGPNGFHSTIQSPIIPNASVIHSGVYEAIVTVNGCSSLVSSVEAIVHAVPLPPVLSSNSPVCTGNELFLSASGENGAKFKWLGPAGYSADVSNPSIPFVTLSNNGQYRVSQEVNGCISAQQVITVIINETPSSPVPTSNSPVCSGQKINLSVTAPNGATIEWLGPNGFSSISETPQIDSSSSVNTGNYFVKFNRNGCESQSAFIGVTVLAVPVQPTITISSSFCEYGDLLLAAKSSSGAVFNWVGPNGFSSSLQQPSVSNLSVNNSGVYTVTPSLGACLGKPKDTLITINPSPITPMIGADLTLCLGDTIRLNAQSNELNFNWIGPSGFFSNQQNPTFKSQSINQSGTYSVSVTRNGCASKKALINVEINPLLNPVSISTNEPVCSGNTLNLSAGFVPNAFYNWKGPNGFMSNQQSPSISNATVVHSGDYEVYISVNGCSSSTTLKSVSILPTPSAPLANSNSPICQGSTLLLNQNETANAVYSWTGPLGFVSNLQNPQISGVTPSNAGTYFVKVIVNGCASDVTAVPVTISPSPTPPVVSNNGPLCEGSNLQLTASDIVGAIYNWTGPNGFSSSQQNPTISDVLIGNAGQYNVVVTTGGGCTGQAATTNATINPSPPKPSITSNSPVCSTNELNIHTNPVSGASYNWTGPNGFSSVSQSPKLSNVQPSSSGIYTLIVSKNGCSSKSTEAEILVKQTPSSPQISVNSGICVGSTLQFSATALPGATYKWSGPQGFNSTVNAPSIPNAQLNNSGKYELKITLDGCESPSSEIDAIISNSTIAGKVTSDATVCSETNNGILSLIGSVGTILNWQVSEDEGKTWVSIANTTDKQEYTNLLKSAMYAAVVKEGNCPAAVANAAKITVIPEVKGGFLAKNDLRPKLCTNDNDGQLTLRDQVGTVLQWEVSKDEGVYWDTILHPYDTLSYHDLSVSTQFRALISGCSKQSYSDIARFEVGDDACSPGIVIASLLTPNKDNNNDTWQIQDIELYPRIEVTIVNRYGVIIYQTDNYKNEWDGTYNGDYLPDGTYYYALKFADNPTIYKGNINLMK